MYALTTTIVRIKLYENTLIFYRYLDEQKKPTNHFKIKG